MISVTLVNRQTEAIYRLYDEPSCTCNESDGAECELSGYLSDR